MPYLSRRRFAALTASAGVAAAAAALFPRQAFGEAQSGPMGLPYGIQLYTVGEPLGKDPLGTLKQLRAIGYTEVEVASLDKITAKQLRAMLDEAGLSCPSTHLQLMAPDLDAAFADAHVLGAKYAVSSVLRDFGAFFKAARAAAKDKSAPPPTLDAMGLDGFQKMAAHMNEVGTKAHAAGLQYCYHNHNFEFEKMPDGTPGYDVLVKETDPDLVKFEVDCGWMVVAGGDPVAYFQKYPGRFRLLHIKDFKPVAKPTTDLAGPNHPIGSDLGTGFIDYKPIFAAGKAAGIEHIFAEQEAPFTVSQMESAKRDFAFLQKFS